MLGSSHRLVPAAQPLCPYPPAWTTARESNRFPPYMDPIGQRLELVSRRWPRPPTWPVIALKTCINTSSTLAIPWCSRDSSSILCPNLAREKDAAGQRFPLTHTCVARVGDPHHGARTVNRQCGHRVAMPDLPKVPVVFPLFSRSRFKFYYFYSLTF